MKTIRNIKLLLLSATPMFNFIKKSYGLLI